MNEAVLTFEASSPEELSALLKETQVADTSSSLRLAALAINGPQILVRPFQYDAISRKELTTRLLHEAVGLLSLPVAQIALTYQTLGSSDEKVHGIYLSLPKKMLHRYLWVLHKANLVPTNITASSALYLDDFLKGLTQEERVCFLNFSNKNTIGLTVILQKRCELLREIPCEDWTEAKAEILQSLRSVCAKSSVKQFDRAYIVGECLHQDELKEQLRANFNVTAEHRRTIDIKKVLEETDIISLNWARSYVFSIKERQQILKVFHGIIVLLLCVSFGLGVKIVMNGRSIKNVKSSYTLAEYQYALELKAKMNK